MKKYRRIEVNAFRRRVTIVSGEWPREIIDQQPVQTDDEVSPNDSDASEPVEPDTPEGQLLLVEAVLSLERRLSLEARATIYGVQNILAPNRPNRNGLYLKCNPSINSFAQKRFALLERRNEMRPANKIQNHSSHHVGLTLTLVSLLSAAMLVLGSARLASAQTAYPNWSYTGNLNTARVSHSATLLATGKVLENEVLNLHYIRRLV